MKTLKGIVIAALAFGTVSLTVSCSSTQSAGPLSPADVPKKLQEDLIAAKPGSVIQLPEGKFQFDRTLSLTVNNVTIRGKGMHKTILSFTGQTKGSAGMLVKADDFAIEDLAIEDAAGDALKVEESTNVTIRRVRVEWTGGPKETNGPYGIYPVTSKNVLVEECVAIAAADAGIYIGQSDNVIIRRNRAERNVAGIEIENTKNADVYENLATNNTGGILVFNLPDLPVQGGEHVRVYNNQVLGNNLANFAPTSQIVSKLATGTGVMVMAIKNVEVFKNMIKDNNTANVLVTSFLAGADEPIKDKNYNPYTASVYVHDNDISGGGKQPDSRLPKWMALAKAAGNPLPDILYDGIIEPKEGKAGTREDARVCIENNGNATFLNFDAGNGFKGLSRDAKLYQCAMEPLAAITLPQSGKPEVRSGGRE